jgi:DegT/DnrJ/EryC1/StrS aminotransferase family protein
MNCFTIPPSGNAIPVSFLLKGGNGDFFQALSSHNGFPVHRILATSSGAAALYIALRGLAALHTGDSARRAVAVPAWCCPSVPQTVIQAGLEPVLVDLDPATLAYDAESLQRARSRGLLAVLLVHFFGLRAARPAGDWPGTAFLRDCAQDFDYRMDPEDDAPCFYSFGRGKALNAGHGGALCMPVPGPWLEACGTALAELPAGQGRILPKALAINLLSHPRLFWALSRIPFLGIGSTEWHRPLAYARLSAGFPAPGSACLEGYLQRRHFYQKLIAGYQSLIGACDASRIASPGTAFEGAESAHAGLPTRFPILAYDPDLREELFRGINARFGGVTRMYPAILSRLPGAPPGLEDAGGGGFPGARRIAGAILTLPVTAELMGREERFLDSLAGILERSGALRARPTVAFTNPDPARDWSPAKAWRRGPALFPLPRS